MDETALIAALIDRISWVASRASGWRVVQQTSRVVQAAPCLLIDSLSPIGAGKAGPRGWFTLNFWVQSPQGGLGVFWRATSVSDKELRNRTLTPVLEESQKTGVEYLGSRDWREMDEPAFSGQTVSAAWWPKGRGLDLSAAGAEVARCIADWNDRVPAIVSALMFARTGSHLPDKVALSHSQAKVRSTSVARPTPQSLQLRKQGKRSALATPPIPEELKQFRAPPAYTSIFEIYPNESRIYGTEDLYGDWSAEVVLMAKDAGNVRNFQSEDKGGRGWPWVHNPSRPTNRNLIPLAEQLPGGKLYASFLGPLLRNDEGESGPLVMSSSIRAFIARLFEWTIESMPQVRTVAVLGQEGWSELIAAVGHRQESRRWKMRHLSGEPLELTVGGKKINMVALNHPARIPARTLMEQPGWRWIVNHHAGGG